MKRVLVGCPIFNFQDLKIRENHKEVRESSIHEVDYVEIVGMNIEQAKQIMYKKFLEGDYDYYFSLDGDLFFLSYEKNPIDALIERDKDIVGGIYYLRCMPTRPAHRPLDSEEYYEKNGEFPNDYKFIIPEDIHEVRWLAGGCVMFKREVIKKLTDKYQVPNLPSIYKKEYIGEDYSICQRAIDEGYKIYADPKIKLGHLGNYLFTSLDYK